MNLKTQRNTHKHSHYCCRSQLNCGSPVEINLVAIRPDCLVALPLCLFVCFLLCFRDFLLPLCSTMSFWNSVYILLISKWVHILPLTPCVDHNSSFSVDVLWVCTSTLNTSIFEVQKSFSWTQWRQQLCLSELLSLSVQVPTAVGPSGPHIHPSAGAVFEFPPLNTQSIHLASLETKEGFPPPPTGLRASTHTHMNVHKL